MRQVLVFSMLLLLCSFENKNNVFSNKESLDYFVGKWEIKMWTGTETGNDPDVIANWFLDKDPENEKAYKGYVQQSNNIFTSETIAFDEKTRLYTRKISVATGIRIEMNTKGWEENKLAWAGTQNDGSNISRLKEEITKINADEFKALFYEFKNGTWALAQTEKLKRISE
jgi:hypothetical protein